MTLDDAQALAAYLHDLYDRASIETHTMAERAVLALDDAMRKTQADLDAEAQQDRALADAALTLERRAHALTHADIAQLRADLATAAELLREVAACGESCAETTWYQIFMPRVVWTRIQAWAEAHGWPRETQRRAK